MYTISVALDRAHYETRVTAGSHTIIADEPLSAGGKNQGADPFELLLASVGSCTAITLRMYADRKAWPLEAIQINLTLAQEKDRSATLITKQITLEGDLTDEQRRRLMQIADKCPTHLVLTRPVTIQSELME